MPSLIEPLLRRRPVPSLRVRRTATTALFALDGAVFGTWAARIPDITAQVGAGPGTLGLILLCVSLGALASMQLTGALCERLGAGAVSAIAAVLTCVSITLPGTATTVPELAAVLLGFGAATGMLNVAANAVGVRVEQAAGRSVVPSLHAAFSLGGLGGAVIAGLVGHGVSLAAHLVALGVAGLIAVSVITPVLLASDEGTMRATPSDDPGVPAAVRRAVVVFGIVAGCTAFGEGAVSDWGALYLRETLAASPELAAVGYACFSVAMAAGRLAGGRLLDRFGATRLLVGGSTVAAAGSLVVASAPDAGWAMAGFAVVGLGLSNVFPVAIGRAGALGGPGGVALASTVGYAGLLGGPPLLGFLAHGFGMATGFVAISLLAATAAVLALLAPPEAPSASVLLHTARTAFARHVLQPAADHGRDALHRHGGAMVTLWPSEHPLSPRRSAFHPGLEALVH